jgi:hypothetical protein
LFIRIANFSRLLEFAANGDKNGYTQTIVSVGGIPVDRSARAAQSSYETMPPPEPCGGLPIKDCVARMPNNSTNLSLDIHPE